MLMDQLNNTNTNNNTNNNNIDRNYFGDQNYGKLYFIDCEDVDKSSGSSITSDLSKFCKSRAVLSPTRGLKTNGDRNNNVTNNDGGYMIQILSKVLIGSETFNNTLNNMINITKSTMETLFNSNYKKLLYDIDGTKGQIFKFTLFIN